MPHAPLVEVSRHDDIAVLSLRNAPVNTLGRSLRRAVLRAIEAAERDPDIAAVVIEGGRNFSAGADLAEFDNGEGLAEPTLHATIADKLDSSRLPSVAAISGAALGGGLELALACSARTAHPAAVLGLPETTLGFMPGAGGTQRLPRAVGVESGVSMIASGRSVTGEQARSFGLVDDVSEDPVMAAVGLARRLVADGDRRRLRDVPLDPRAAGFADLAFRDAKRTRSSAGVISALEALRAGATDGFDTGLDTEFKLFVKLAGSSAAKAARYRFLSERSGARVGTAAALPERVGVVGAGTMGRGIAQSLLGGGFTVILIDTERERVDAGVDAITASLTSAVAKGRMTEEARDAQLSRLTGGVGLQQVADAGLIIEAVYEDLEVKREVFAAIDVHAPAGAVLASNTSSLDLDAIAAATSRPESVVGMHFFSPAHVMRLVEVVDGSSTSPEALAMARAVVSQMRKIGVVAQVGPGFIGNRIFDQYLRQAHLLLLDGITPERIDSALERWGMAMGPFRVLDIVGNDVTRLARQARADSDPAWTLADRLAEEGWLGRKSGSGWYLYDGPNPTPNPAVIELLPPQIELSDDAIVERCILAIVTEAARVIESGVARDGADVDTVMVNGYGFPASKGGPWFWATERGWDTTADGIIRQYEATHDPFWKLPDLIATLADDGSAVSA
ncbi:MAG: 3-hydroxyacyl-CoA dehydrogenase NAD-binding domain-containing protein [Mycetocola sp.]